MGLAASLQSGDGVVQLRYRCGTSNIPYPYTVVDTSCEEGGSKIKVKEYGLHYLSGK